MKKTLSRTASRAQAGSAIVGVLAALVFIGIVTGAMVKSTGSQSRASTSLGNMLAASSTLNSGILATETKFQSIRDTAMILGWLNNWNGQKKVVIGTTSGNKVNKELLAAGTGQYYSSELTDFRDTDLKVAFYIASGRTQGDRAMRESRAFFNVGNIEPGTTRDDFGGSNAFSVAGSGTFANANAGMTVYGHATFENGLNVNQGAVTFEPIPGTTTGSVYVNGKAIFESSVPSVTFNVPAYFDGNTTLQSTTIDFNKGIGFNGHVGANSRTINVKNNAYLNGDFGSVVGAAFNRTTTLTLNGVNPGGGVLHHTGAFPIETRYSVNCSFAGPNAYGKNIDVFISTNAYCSDITSVSANNNCYPMGDGCGDIILSVGDCLWKSTGYWVGNLNQGVHSWDHNCAAHPTGHINNTQITGSFQTNRESGYSSNANGDRDTIGNSMLVDLNMVTSQRLNDLHAAQKTVLDDRREPTLTLGNISDNKKFTSLSDVIKHSGSTLVTPEAIQSYINHVKTLSNSQNYFENGHLLISVGSKDGANFSSGNSVFRDRVMFVVEDGGSLNVNKGFYNSAYHTPSINDPNKFDTASTVIYVKDGGKIEQMGTKDNSIFSGLIYVEDRPAGLPPRNPALQNTFSWGSNCRIEGAVIVNGGVLNWNYNSNGAIPTKIYRNNNILSRFGYLMPDSFGESNEDGHFVLIDDKKGITLGFIGVYLH